MFDPLYVGDAQRILAFLYARNALAIPTLVCCNVPSNGNCTVEVDGLVFASWWEMSMDLIGSKTD